MLECDSTAAANAVQANIDAVPVNLKLDLPLVTAIWMPNLTHSIAAQVSDWAIPQCIDYIKALLCTLKSTLKLWTEERGGILAAMADVEVL